MRITWGDIRPYSQGVKQGVLFPNTGPGVPWNGLISVTVKGDDAASSLYIDGRRHRNRSSPSTFSGTISAFTYPDEFDSCIGVLSGWVMSQNKNPFGLTWRDNRELHIVYNAITSPSNDQYQTIGANVNPLTFSWDFTTTPVDIPAGGYSAHVVIMLDYVQPSALVDLEALIYGDDSNDPSLPDPFKIYGIFESYTTVTITDNQDGTWTANGPDSLISVSGSSFTIAGAFVTVVDADNYKIRSL